MAAGSPRTTTAQPAPPRADYTGAVYGSLLAAGVIAGSSPREDPASAPSLMVLLVATGLVFWLAHVYARLAGDRSHGPTVGWAEVKAVGASEWPVAQAAFLPAATVCVGWLLGMAKDTTALLALLVALAGQVGWAVVASIRAGAGRWSLWVSASINLLLGLVIVAVEILLPH
ncbi:hypothetical protein ACQP1W_02870 [Spirillospora sp. CA-255316]